ncbi:GcvT family protein [Aestuariispira insulae]|uniref:Dimethylglycine dehydrogenase n=1 Tax=Aestuariispira insulae TaxID=1461337 RepID=A0A3D9HVN1_9PROT|nr:FAD-dependent oxidoreductase [Aestuariispira insulae]RED53465.1 dimethylglycine dehydrogenase [Aestuariispira insulae]
MQSHARVVIIGGGIVGCSALYHLAKMGETDVVLLEMDELTSGSTWHAAGNIPTYAGSWNIMKYQRYSSKLYETLAEEVDYPINYHVTGSIRLANNKDRMDEFHHVTSMARKQGMEYEMLSPSEMKDRYPFLELHNMEGGLWDPYDGDIDPSQVTQALAKGARDLGAVIHRFTPVTGISKLQNGEWKVSTPEGDITCEIVVNAAGYRGAEVAAMVGQFLPIATMSHQYLVTESVPELSNRDTPLPLLRDPDDSYYLRQERDGLILGPYEWKATPMWQDGIPENFAYQLWSDDLERLEWYIEQAMGRVPILASAGIQKVINGPIPYSPDGYPYIGPAHGLKNFYHCCSFSFGICQGGGAGKTIAEYIVEGEPEWDMWGLDPRRYTDYANQKYVTDKAVELYQHEYAIGYPHEEREAGRPAKTTPVYEKLKAKGAMFGARGGWERATWFVPEGQEAKQDLSFRRSDVNWTEAVAQECKTVREKAGILDLGGFSRYIVKGDGAEAWLDRMICGKLPKTGRLSLSYMLGEAGGVMCEFTILRNPDDSFLLISAAAGLWHDEDWLNFHKPEDGSVTIENVTARYGCLVLAGPESRDILGKITSASLENKDFPWLSAQTIDIGFSSVLAMRVNYVGELGWELHVPMEYLGAVYDLVWDAGQEHGLIDFGMYAMDSLRLEKCYRGWKSDLGHEYSPLKSSLDRFMDLDKAAFKGKAALEKELREGVKERFVPLLVEADGADAPFCSSVFDGDDNIGLVTSGGYGHTIGKSIALAYIRTDLAKPGTKLEVEILGKRYPAAVAQEPLFDPDNERPRA